MNSELPPTPGRLIYDTERAIELLGGDPGDARALVTDAVAMASMYGRTLGVAYQRGDPLPAPPERALFGYMLGDLVDKLLQQGPEAATVASMLLTHPQSTQFHRDELTRWASAVGLLQTSHMERQAAVQAESRSLTKNLVAAAFEGLGNTKDWTKRLANPNRWLVAARVEQGARGGKAATWDPIKIGAGLVVNEGVEPKSVRSRFQSRDALRPWLDAWKTYEAEHFEP